VKASEECTATTEAKMAIIDATVIMLLLHVEEVEVVLGTGGNVVARERV
jgi:hypothetical protein